MGARGPRIFWFLCVSIWTPALLAGDFVVDNQAQKMKLGKYVDYLRDDTDQVRLEEFLSLYGQGKLTRGEIDVPKFGIAGKDVAFWFHLKLIPQLSAHKSYLLLLEPAYLRYVDVYRLDAENRILDKMEIGQHRPSANRPLYHHAFPIRVTLEKEPLQFVFRVKSNSVSFDLALYDLPTFFEKEVKERWFQYAYFGAMLIIFLHYSFTDFL